MKKLTLFYAENARGKSTIAAIFHSLRTHDTRYVGERTTLGSSGDVKVHFRFDDTSITYEPNGWCGPSPQLEILDPIFVAENVYSGEEVGHDQRKKLYRFALGEEAVRLSDKVDNITKKVNNINNIVSELKQQILRYVEGGMDIDEFVNLPAIDDIDTLIEEERRQLETLKQAETIRSKALLKTVELPGIPFSSLVEVLGKTLSGITASVEQKVKQHIERCMDERGESWIEQGMQYVHDNSCPFCGRGGLESLDLVTAYKGYFSETYKELKEEIKRLSQEIDGVLSENALLEVQHNLNENGSLTEFWSQHLNADFPSMEFDEIQQTWVSLREAIRESLYLKSSAPLEPVTIDSSFQNAYNMYQQISGKASKYNEEVAQINSLIEDKKKELESGDIQSAENKVNRLRNTKIRYTEEVSSLCKKYLRLQKGKDKLNDRKQQTRDKLTNLTDQLLQQYQNQINDYLVRFGADFKITEVTQQYYGGTPRMEYQLSIYDQAVPLSVQDSVAAPAFKNTLSSGDRTSLALAFFLAKLDADPQLKNKVIVFDDPLSSLDGYRRMQTKQEILRLAGQANQVVVLSHDPYFIRMIWEGAANKDDVKALCIQRSGSESNIQEWDIEKETQGDYYRNYFALAEYLERGPSGDLRDVARCIRPLLEGNLRIRFPGQFPSRYSLGDMAFEVDKAQTGMELSILHPILQELRDINEYAKRYSHSDNPGANQEPINDGELKSYVNRALSIIPGIFGSQ
ncbi:MAG: AAA family ATPase [Dehalococcoidia bacterium]